MNLASRFDKLVPDLASALTRFPIPAAFSVLLCAYLNIFDMDIWSGSGSQVAGGAAAGFFAAGAAHFFAEGRGLARGTNLLLAIAAAAAAALLGYFTKVFETQYLFLFFGLIPLLMIAPFLHESARQGALWLFNLRLWLAALLAFIVALAFAAGLSAIVAALDFLFGARFNGLHEHIWATAIALVAPIYALSLMPRRLDEEVDIDSHKDTLLERGVSVLVNYVLVPVIVVYALILHAYAIKIVLEQQLPNGNIATMVSIFAVGGTGAWLIAWPWRERGTRLLRLFMRGWFWLTIVPAALLVIAVWRRIGDYGVTPERYGIAIIAVWIVGLTAYLAYRRNRADMRAILGGLAVLLLIGSAGPFGANGLTIRTQMVRFERLLTESGLLQDGKAVAPTGKVSSEVTSEGYSILGALNNANGLDRLAPWFEGDDKSLFKPGSDGWTLQSDIATFFGFNYPQVVGDTVNFYSNAPLSAPFTGSVRIIGPLQAIQNYQADRPQQPMTALFDNDVLTIKLDATTIYRVENRVLAEKIKEGLSGTGIQPAVAVSIAPDVTLLIDQFYGNLSNTPPLSSARFWVVIRSGV